MKKIIAAGGLVTNADGNILMIFRRGKWDLPKGKLDAGETIEECAVREVEEETGLRNIILGDFLLITKHQYFDQWIQEKVIKESHWYKMNVRGEQKLVPQTEEDITEIKWVNRNELAECLQNTYPSIIEVITQYSGNRD